MSLGHGLRLALTTFTVLPLPVGRVDRRAATAAMALAPIVGAGLGAVVGAAALGLRWAGLTDPVAALLAVGLGVLLSRGLHLDGLADTVDALGSYGDQRRALEIMRKPDIGPFGVTAICLNLLTQAACLVALLGGSGPGVVGALATAYASGRLAATVACSRGVPAARPEGLGALFAGTVPRPLTAAVAIAVGVAAGWVALGAAWLGPAAVGVAVAVTAGLLIHLVRRFGGITGDVLGFLIEVATLASLVVLTLD